MHEMGKSIRKTMKRAISTTTTKSDSKIQEYNDITGNNVQTLKSNKTHFAFEQRKCFASNPKASISIVFMFLSLNLNWSTENCYCRVKFLEIEIQQVYMITWGSKTTLYILHFVIVFPF